MRKTVTFLFLLIFIFTVPKISSAERSKILVEKGVIDLGMQTEKDTEFSFYVKNDSSESQKINISVKDIEFGEDNSFSVMEALDGPSSWVSFSEKDFIALPQEKKIIAGKIKFPDEARGKAFYNMLIFVSFSDAESKSEAGGPQVHGKIGVYLLIKNGDKKKSSGKIENIFVGKILHKDNNIKVAYKNTGDVYFVPEHKGVLKNFLGLRKQEFFLDQRFVFPGKTIDFSGIMKNVPVWGIFQIKVRFVDGMGVVSESNKYACGYLFPWLALAFCAGGIFLVIVILRKRNQMKIWLLMKK